MCDFPEAPLWGLMSGGEPGSAGELVSELGPDGLAGLSRNKSGVLTWASLWTAPSTSTFSVSSYTLQPRVLCPAVPSAPHSSL